MTGAVVVTFTPPSCVREPGKPRARHQWGEWTPNHTTGRYVTACQVCGKTRARTSLPVSAYPTAPVPITAPTIAGATSCTSCGGSGWRFLDGTAEVVRCNHNQGDNA